MEPLARSPSVQKTDEVHLRDGDSASWSWKTVSHPRHNMHGGAEVKSGNRDLIYLYPNALKKDGEILFDECR